MKLITKLELKAIMVSLMISPLVAQAASDLNGLSRLKNTADQIGFTTADIKPQSVIMQIVLAALGFVGLIFLIMIIYAGFQWMTAGGNEEKIKDAKKRLQHSIIGLVVIMAAFAIATYVANILVKSTTEGYYSD